jgi:hypothetical protein
MRLIRVCIRLLVLFVLAVVGASIASVAAAAYMRPRLADDASPDDDELQLAAVLTGRDFRSTASAFRGGRVICWNSGLDVDLRGARLDPAGGDLEVWTAFGGASIRVPEDWRVAVRGMSVLGGATAAAAPFDDLEPGPVLQIRHRTLLGGFSVKAEPDDAVAVA